MHLHAFDANKRAYERHWRIRICIWVPLIHTYVRMNSIYIYMHTDAIDIYIYAYARILYMHICMWTPLTHTYVRINAIDTYIYVYQRNRYIHTCIRTHRIHMGWLQLVGSIKLKVSFAQEPYKRDYILPKRPIKYDICRACWCVEHF